MQIIAQQVAEAGLQLIASCRKCGSEFRQRSIENVAGPGGKDSHVAVFECPTCGRLNAHELVTARSPGIAERLPSLPAD
jgi:uncharacterized Zn finger protein